MDSKPISQISSISHINIAVVDTGHGMPDDPDNVKKLFQPFVSTDGSTGLGLYAVQQNCEALGGTLGVKHNPSAQGCVFWFQIPYVTDESVAKRFQSQLRNARKEMREMVTVEAMPDMPDDRQVWSPKVKIHSSPREIQDDEDAAPNIFKQTVLIIDDIAPCAKLHAAQIKAMGVRVRIASGCHQALDLMKQQEYALVLCDIKMPIQDGDELVAGFRQWELGFRD